VGVKMERLVHIEDCVIVRPDSDWAIMVMKGRAVVPALKAYKVACKELHCEDTHIESIRLLIERVEKFQEDFTEYTKAPDTNLRCEVDRCIGGIDIYGKPL
jgi:hypothetical protein